MGALRSAPRGDRLLLWRVWAIGVLAAWTVPAGLGLVVLNIAHAGAWLLDGMTVLAPLGRGAYLMAFSLIFAALWLVQLTLAAWALLRLGAAGWASLIAAGAVCGALGLSLVPGMSPAVGLALGAMNGFVLWFVFSRMQPEIFTTR